MSDKTKTVKDFLGKDLNFECMGCGIANGDLEIPAGIIYKGIHVILAIDPEIPLSGFLILCTKRHVRSFSECTKEEREEISEILYYSEKALKDLNIVQKVTLIQEEKSGHFHIWIYPNYIWLQKKFGEGIDGIKPAFEYVKENVKKNKKIIKRILDTADNIKEYFEEIFVD